jgi:hypothetical protein
MYTSRVACLRCLQDYLSLAYLLGCLRHAAGAGSSGPSCSLSRDTRVPADALNPEVGQETIWQTICVLGCAASAKPSTSYTNGVKSKLLRVQSLRASHPQASALWQTGHQKFVC